MEKRGVHRGRLKKFEENDNDEGDVALRCEV